MPAAVIWLIVAFGLAGAEALTGDMSLLMLGGGALAAAGSSWLLGLPVWTDGVVFLVVSVLLLLLVRPALRRLSLQREDCGSASGRWRARTRWSLTALPATKVR